MEKSRCFYCQEKSPPVPFGNEQRYSSDATAFTLRGALALGMFILQSEASSAEVHVEGINSSIIFFTAKDKREKVAYLLSLVVSTFVPYIFGSVYLVHLPAAAE